MTSIPEDSDALLSRKAFAAALTEAGFPTSPATIASKATRGGGPEYLLYGRRALYRWGAGLAWAQSRLSAPRRSTSESPPTPKKKPAPHNPKREQAEAVADAA